MSKFSNRKIYFEKKDIKVQKITHGEGNATLKSRDIFFFGLSKKFVISVVTYKVSGHSYPLYDKFYNYDDVDPRLEIFSFTLFNTSLEFTRYYGVNS